MTANEHGQGELMLGQRVKRSRMGHPHGGRGRQEPTKAVPPGRRGAQFVSDPATTAEATKRKQLAEQMEGIALAIGILRGTKGFPMWRVRERAVIDGVLTGDEGRPDTRTGRNPNPRSLSWLGSLLPGMARQGLLEKLTIDGRPQYDTSGIEGAHGNKNLLWVITAEGRAAFKAGKARTR